MSKPKKEVEPSQYPCLRIMKVSDITPWKRNPRKISEISMERLDKSVSKLGNLQPVTFNVRTGNLVGGHQRLKLMIVKQVKETPVWCVDLTESQEKLANIALNNTYGNWDEAILKDIIEEVHKENGDFEMTGFDDEWAQKIVSKYDIPTEDQAISELRLEDQPVYGDIGWLVIRCPKNVLADIKVALSPFMDKLSERIQVESNG